MKTKSTKLISMGKGEGRGRVKQRFLDQKLQEGKSTATLGREKGGASG